MDYGLVQMIKLPKLTELKPRERLLATGAGLILAVVVLDRLVLNPWFHRIHTVKEETLRMELALQRYHKLLARRDFVTRQLKAYQRYLRQPLTDELQMASLLKEVEGVAERSRVQLIEIKPLATESDELVSRYSLEVQFECTLEEWVDFVTGIEASPSLIEIARASLAVQEDVPDRLKASLRMTSAATKSGGAPHAAVP